MPVLKYQFMRDGVSFVSIFSALLTVSFIISIKFCQNQVKSDKSITLTRNFPNIKWFLVYKIKMTEPISLGLWNTINFIA